MKQQLLIIGLLLAIVPCFSQSIQTQGSPKRATHYLGGLQADSTLVVPVRNHDSIYPNLPYKGRVQINSETNLLEYHNGEDWVTTGADGSGDSGEAVKIEDEIDGYTAHVGFPETATADSYWVFPQGYSSAQNPIYVPLEINGAVAGSGGSVAVGIQGVLNASTSDGMVAGYDRLNFYVTDSSLDIYPNIFTYNSTPDEENFTTVGGVRNDGRTFGPDAIAESDYVTKSQLDDALTSTTSPVQSVDEGHGIGIIITGRNDENYGNVGLGAVDLSVSADLSYEYGATGDYSFAAGQYTTAQGDYSFAAGYKSEANGPSSVAMGSLANASGGISTALGSNTITNAFASTVIGYNNLPITGTVENSPIAGSPVFIIGNGTDNITGRSNAYVLYNDGKSTQNGIASYGNDYSASYTQRSLVDKEYVDGVASAGNSFLQIIQGNTIQRLKFKDNIINSAHFELPDREGMWTFPTSFNGKTADEVTGEIFLTLEDILSVTQTTPDSPAITNNLYISSQSSGEQDILIYEQYIDEGYNIVAGVKYDGRAYGPQAVAAEDYAPLSQIESLITAATGEITLNAEDVFTNGSNVSVPSSLDLRSDAGIFFTHNATGNKLELDSDGLRYNNNQLIDKTALIGYIASATNTTFTAHKTATDLNSAYPGVYEGFMVKCPNAGVIYIKTSIPGQWQLIGATTLNP